MSFDVRDVADPGLSGRYDLVTIFEAVHDLSRPVEVLEAMKGLLAEGGTAPACDPTCCANTRWRRGSRASRCCPS